MSTTALPPQPRILPQNRKIRHLRGLSLRNLTFTRPVQDRAVDDTAINKSPSKLAALRSEAQKQGILHHAHSTEGLRRPQQPRRRSTLSAASADPVTRQKELDAQVEARTADVFYSLHCEGQPRPIYISEMATRVAVRTRLYAPLEAAM